MKKYIFIFTVSALLLIAIKISFNYTSPSTQIIINTPSLNNIEMVENIRNELSKMSGISFYELSLSTTSVLVNYDEDKINDKDILGVLNKWGCEDYQISFNLIF